MLHDRSSKQIVRKGLQYFPLFDVSQQWRVVVRAQHLRLSQRQPRNVHVVVVGLLCIAQLQQEQQMARQSAAIRRLHHRLHARRASTGSAVSVVIIFIILRSSIVVEDS